MESDIIRDALAQYGRILVRDGWEAAEPLIASGEARWPGSGFRKWAWALGIMMRAGELLEDSGDF